MSSLSVSLHTRIHPRLFKAGLLVILALGLLPQARQAHAKGSTCNGQGLPYTCVYVYGSGTVVTEVEVTHAHAGSGKYCNYRGDVALYRGNGQRIGEIYRSGTSDCSSVRPWVRIDIDPDTDIGKDGYVCARWYEGGVQDGDRTCHKIRGAQQ